MIKNAIAKIFSFLLALTFVFSMGFQIACNNSEQSNLPDYEETDMEIEKEFNSFIKDLSAFPVKFTYDDVKYNGFSPEDFKTESKKFSVNEDKSIVSGDITLRKSSSLKIRISAKLYRKYNAFDYTVYFENDSSENSGILSEISSFNYYVTGEKPRLKGILGDHKNNYTPYDYKLSSRAVVFDNTLGRACHVNFPYFNLETDDGGYMIALGWGGTWEANFSYNSKRGTHIDLKSCTGLTKEGTYTYLAPGEVYRTALIGVVRYYERNEDVATNAWRKWIVDCNLPRENSSTTSPVAPSMSTCLAWDSDRENSDGSISEYYGSWKRSLDAMYSHGLNLEFRWFDAGWYLDPNGRSVPKDWYGTVGTWTLDNFKWPDNSFKESVEYAKEHGSKTLVWFEPERVSQVESLSFRYGYKKEWALSNGNSSYLSNLGNKDCFDWTLNKIISFMSENDIDLYREDFNLEPSAFWNAGDTLQGFDRYGITENLHMQGHYALWDGIIDWCAKNGKCTYVDSCASGGGRNDLESVRRSVPLLRSDSDRTTIGLKLAYTTSLCKWLPYTGACATDSTNQLGAANLDLYVMRAAFLPHMNISGRWYHNQDTLPWDDILQGRSEWLEASKYFLKDFYVLTYYHSIDDESNWTAYMYWDTDTDSGLLQAFRQKDCSDNSVNVQVKGVNPDKYYSIRDIDGKQSVARVLGSDLQNGLNISAQTARSAIVLYIEPVL